MITIRLTPKTRAFALKCALNVLRKGGILSFATETVYGIGCDPRNAKAVRRIFAMKGRDEKKPLQIIAGSMAQVARLADLHQREKKIASRYWPGPLTLIVKLKDIHSRAGAVVGATHGSPLRPIAPRASSHGTIGIRVTSDRFLRDLLNAFGFPIAATSANRSGQKPATSGVGVRCAFVHRASLRRCVVASSGRRPTPDATTPDLLIDVGALPRRKPTTVARITDNGRVEILRQGGISI